MLFDILVEESKFEETENCLKHLLDTHKNWSGLAEKVHAKLKEMYRATGQTEMFGDMLKTMVVAQSRMDFYKEYRNVVREAGELLKYEGGLPEVNRLKISWLTRFKNRPAMRDELEKI